MSADVTMLAEVPLFSLLGKRERQTLAEILESKPFDKGDTIFAFGDAGDCLYLLRTGRVEIYVENTEGEKIVLAAIEPGELFGEISLFDGGARFASAVAVEDSHTLVFASRPSAGVRPAPPSVALDLLTIMGRSLRNTDELLRSRVSRNLNEEEEESLTFGQRVADKVAAFGGSWTFIILFMALLKRVDGGERLSRQAGLRSLSFHPAEPGAFHAGGAAGAGDHDVAEPAVRQRPAEGRPRLSGQPQGGAGSGATARQH